MVGEHPLYIVMNPLHKLVISEFAMQAFDIHAFPSDLALSLVEAVIRKLTLQKSSQFIFISFFESILKSFEVLTRVVTNEHLLLLSFRNPI